MSAIVLYWSLWLLEDIVGHCTWHAEAAVWNLLGLFMRVCFLHCLIVLHARLLEDIVGHCTWHAEAAVWNLLGVVFVSAGVVVRSVPADA
jgi:hypothetical protein